MAVRKVNEHGRVTLRDVARAAGVHPGTASRALNEQTRSLVNAETAQRVLAVAESLGYHPNPIARGLKTRRSYTIGVLIPDILNPLFPPIIRGIEDRLEQAGYTSVIANTENDAERERIDFRAMLARQVDGFITATARLDHALLDEITGLGVPVVLVNRRVEDGTLRSATADDRAGIKLAVDHLAELGHRQIAFIGGPKSISTMFRRYEGFKAVMRKHRLKTERKLTLVGDEITIGEGQRLCRQLLDSGRPFTAIVAANDLMALGCYDVFSERGLVCPDDVSVVGYNDMPFSDHFNPPLTTIRIPHYQMGLAAAGLLLAQLDQGSEDDAREVVLDPSLVVRGSTARRAE
ncbi:MAG TPA: LacI family DNA-binding transcriptional regulator [Thermoleophilaceae bacterium]|nr:LacI family DNA-binding transcriptional regulator [Thermoleophilaceae bacterium]